MLLGLGFLALWAWVMGVEKEIWEGHKGPGCVSERWAGMAGRKEGEH